jgi:hypothetical protein
MRLTGKDYRQIHPACYLKREAGLRPILRPSKTLTLYIEYTRYPQIKPIPPLLAHIRNNREE